MGEDSEERNIWNENAQELVAGINEKASALDEPRRLHKEQLGKVSSKIAIARKSKTKKREKRMIGKRKTRWKCIGMRMRIWRRFGNEGKKEALCRWKSCKKVTEFVVHEHMSQGEEVECTIEKNKVKGWSIEEMKDKVNSLLEVDTEDEKKGKV